MFEFDNDEEFVTSPNGMADSAIYFDGSKSDGRATPIVQRTGDHLGIHVDSNDEDDDVDLKAQQSRRKGNHLPYKAIPVPNSSMRHVLKREDEDTEAISHELSTSVVLQVLTFQSKDAPSLSLANEGKFHDSSFGDVSSVPVKVGLDDFEMISVIGKGAYGKVYLVRKRGTELLFAMKVLKKASIVVYSKLHEHTTVRCYYWSISDSDFLPLCLFCVHVRIAR